MKKRILSTIIAAVMTTSTLTVPASAAWENRIVVNTYAAKSSLNKPKIKISEVTEKSVKIKWEKISGAEKYQVYYSTKKDGEYKRSTTTSKTETTIKDLKAGTTYYFKVRAQAIKNGKKVYSNYSSVKSAATKESATKKVVYNNLEITLYTDKISFATLENRFSDDNGKKVVVLPVKVKNLSDKINNLSYSDLDYYGPSGTELSSTTHVYFDDDAFTKIRSGIEIKGNLYFLYDGDGDYYIGFGYSFYDDYQEVKVPVKA